MANIIIQIALWVAGISAIGLSFCGGVLWQMSREDKKISARVIRPANITIEKHVYVTEYNVVNSDAIDLDFPKTEKVR